MNYDTKIQSRHRITMLDIFELLGFTGNIPKIRGEVESFFTKGVSLPTKRVKKILTYIYRKNGLDTKPKSTDLANLWGLKIETQFHRDSRTGKLIRYTVIK